MKNILSIIAVFVFTVGTIVGLSADEITGNTEADKFLREARSQFQKSRPDLAVVAAGKAFQLAPKNNDVRFYYYMTLCDSARYELSPEKYQNWIDKPFSPAPEAAEKAIAAVKRCLDLVEESATEFNGSKNSRSRSPCAEPRSFFEAVQHVSPPPFPDWDKEIAMIKERQIRNQREYDHQYFRDRIKDQKTFVEWTWGVRLPFFTVEYQPLAVKVAYCGEVLEEFLKQRKTYDLYKPERQAAYTFNEYENMFQKLAVYALSRPDGDESDAKETVRRIMEVLRNEKELHERLVAWLIDATVVYVKESGIKEFDFSRADPESVVPGGPKQKPLLGKLSSQSGIIANGYFWGGLGYIDGYSAKRWGRVSLENPEQREFLVVPREVKRKDDWFPDEIIAMPDGSGLIVCDFRQVYLLTFDK